jgi:hypothetical protein
VGFGGGGAADGDFRWIEHPLVVRFHHGRSIGASQRETARGFASAVVIFTIEINELPLTAAALPPPHD